MWSPPGPVLSLLGLGGMSACAVSVSAREGQECMRGSRVTRLHTGPGPHFKPLLAACHCWPCKSVEVCAWMCFLSVRGARRVGVCASALALLVCPFGTACVCMPSTRQLRNSIVCGPACLLGAVAASYCSGRKRLDGAVGLIGLFFLAAGMPDRHLSCHRQAVCTTCVCVIGVLLVCFRVCPALAA